MTWTGTSLPFLLCRARVCGSQWLQRELHKPQFIYLKKKTTNEEKNDKNKRMSDILRLWRRRPNIGSCYRLDTVLSLVLRLVSVWGLIWVLLLPQLDQAMTLPTDTYPHSTRMRTPNPSLRYYQAAGALQQHPRPLLITLTPTWLQLSPRVHIEGHSATSWGKRELLEPVESSFCWMCYN